LVAWVNEKAVERVLPTHPDTYFDTKKYGV